jgi:hypothetical protein
MVDFFKKMTKNDPSDHLANVGHVITIEDARGNEKLVTYKAFLTNFEDRYESNWNETEVYARMDPIYTYQSTKRTISIAYDVPAYDSHEAQENMNKSAIVQRLLYPSYDINGGIATLSAAPIFKVKFANLIQDTQNGTPLFGIIKAWSFKPNLGAGFFTQTDSKYLNSTILVPKVLEISFDFHVLHAHRLGYNKGTNKFRSDAGDTAALEYPYGNAKLTKQDPTKNYSGDLESTAPSQSDGPGAISESQNMTMLEPTQTMADSQSGPAGSGMSTDGGGGGGY